MKSQPSFELASAVRDVLDHHGITQSGRDLIAQVQTGPPARPVEGGGGNVCGRYPSRKMQCTIQYESRTVEFPFVMSCEIDSEVVAYYDQPVCLSLRFRGKDGRDVVVGHIPDFLMLGHVFAGVVECKDESRLEALAARHPARYVRGEDQVWRCPPGGGGGPSLWFGLSDMDPSRCESCSHRQRPLP